MAERKSLANIKLHPALIVLGALALSTAGRNFWKLETAGPFVSLAEGLGKGLMAVGVVALVFAYGAMARAGTTLDPRQHSSAIVTRGIYRLSRNPIYLGWFLLLLGGGLANASLFQVLVAVGMIGLLHGAVVLKEEKYLAARFGDTYVRYTGRVRRWL